MTEQFAILIRIKPHNEGPHRHGRAIIRTYEVPHYLSVTVDELAIVRELTQQQTTVEEFVRRYLSGAHGVTFREAVQLLLRLDGAHFLEGDPQLKALHRFEDLTVHANSPWYRALHTLKQTLLRFLDIPLRNFSLKPEGVLPAVRGFGRALLAPFPLIAIFLGVILLFAALPEVSQENSGFQTFVERPATLAVGFVIALTLSGAILAFIQMLVLSGTGAAFMPGSIRLSGLCLFRIQWSDDDPLITPHFQMIRYYAFCTMLPWFLGTFFWNINDGRLFRMVASGFLAWGVLSVCPLIRSPLIKMAEGHLAMLNLLSLERYYIKKGVFTNLFTKNWNVLPVWGNRAFWTLEDFLATLACVTMMWLGATSAVLALISMTVVPSALAALHTSDSLLENSATVILVGLLLFVTVFSSFRWIMLPWENLSLLAKIPLRKVRRGINTFRRKRAQPTEETFAFLRESPLFGQLEDHKLRETVRHLQQTQFRAGRTIVSEGERGHHYYVISSGEAVVLHDEPDGSERVVVVLGPGDSFGEIALLNNITRTATVKALSKVSLFLIDKRAFDTLFPEGSQDRNLLTQLIRRVKLVLESQALSHLSPTQVREFLRRSKAVTFSKHQTIVKAGDPGNAVFVIESGTASVRMPNQHAVRLGRGDIIGAIAVIKGIARTADVIAQTETVCLGIDRQAFLQICMSNMIVAMLAAELSEQQLREQKAA